MKKSANSVALIVANEEEIQQALLSLIQNAEDALLPSGPPLLKEKISARADAANPIPMVRIAVAKLNRDLMIIIFVLLCF